MFRMLPSPGLRPPSPRGRGRSPATGHRIENHNSLFGIVPNSFTASEGEGARACAVIDRAYSSLSEDSSSSHFRCSSASFFLRLRMASNAIIVTRPHTAADDVRIGAQVVQTLCLLQNADSALSSVEPVTAA